MSSWPNSSELNSSSMSLCGLEATSLRICSSCSLCSRSLTTATGVRGSMATSSSRSGVPSCIACGVAGPGENTWQEFFCEKYF